MSQSMSNIAPDRDSANAVVRIALVHALRESIDPVNDAFRRLWPEAGIYNLLDESLSQAVADTGALTPEISSRVETLLRFAIDDTPTGTPVAAVLFTGTAFGPALAKSRLSFPVPILTPHEAAFERAIRAGSRIALVLSFPPSVALLQDQLEEMMRAAGGAHELTVITVPGALDALRRGDTAGHDRIVAEAVGETNADTILLGQFSMARAADAARQVTKARIISTPETAVLHLRERFADPQAPGPSPED